MYLSFIFTNPVKFFVCTKGEPTFIGIPKRYFKDFSIPLSVPLYILFTQSGRLPSVLCSAKRQGH
nr:MAG TPA: hypothetical protein [Caudoviricetes sp.]